MRKTVFLSVLAMALAMPIVHAETANPKTETALLVSKLDPFCMAVAKGDLEAVNTMLKHGADVNMVSNGMTPAMYAARYNRVEILKVLIRQGADLSKTSKAGLTALKYAEISNAIDALRLIEESSNS